MNCLGDCRSDTFSPRASRSRSRWRIFSRSIATDFMRLGSGSEASSGIAMVSTVAIAATPARIIATRRVSCRMEMMVWTCRSLAGSRRFQKSKLIIFFMTMQPMNIQVALPSSINCPVGWVQSSSI